MTGRQLRVVGLKPRRAATPISSGPQLPPVHIEDEAWRTVCGRVTGAVQVATAGAEVTCQRCLKKFLKQARDDSTRRSRTRNRIEARAKACFEIWDRHTGAGLVWETVSENQREAFRQILDYTESLFLDDDGERRERYKHERGKPL